MEREEEIGEKERREAYRTENGELTERKKEERKKGRQHIGKEIGEKRDIKE